MMYRPILILAGYFLLGSNFAQTDYERLRKLMVTKQIKARGINDASTLKAMNSVPRHLFVPKNLRKIAYSDRPLPIGYNQTISQPYIVAFMTEELQLKPTDRVLEIGTGSGYQAAVLAEIVDSVFTIEIISELGISAGKRFQSLGYDTIELRIGDGYNGWKEKGPFNAIIVTAAIDTIPPPLLEQLAEGGRMIIPVGQTSKHRNLQLVTKQNGKISVTNRLPVRFVPFTRKKD